ncbi:MAG TPA: DUF2065 domain-containing protein [Desulfomonilaceae bacterium]|nr:DUF2065 domain-containing protein [Desulfomonilaceae bacterium]
MTMEFFFCVLGMVLVIEGLPYFGFPEKMRDMMRFLHEQDDMSLRIMGATLMAIGLLILFFARRGLGSS